jgi:hypothetical protein
MTSDDLPRLVNSLVIQSAKGRNTRVISIGNSANITELIAGLPDQLVIAEL